MENTFKKGAKNMSKKNNPNIFISYASENKDTAFKVVDKLEASAMNCFIAPRDIIAGMDYSSAIVAAIESCDVIVLIFSSNSDKSGYVLREINSAVLHNKVVIPFRIEDIVPSKSMEFYLGKTHWLDAFPEILDEHIKSLSKTINKICIKEDANSEKMIIYKGPTMVRAKDLNTFGYDIKKMVLKTIEIDYQTIDPKRYIINNEIEGTVNDWIEDCISYQDTYALLVVNDEIVGYWSFTLMNEQHFCEIINGAKMINASMSEFYDFGGDFYCYIGLMPIINEHANASNYMIMLDELFDTLTQMHSRGINVLHIGISVYSDIVEKLVVRLGFNYVGDNLAKGKIYVLKPENIAKSSVIQTKYSAFSNCFIKED